MPGSLVIEVPAEDTYGFEPKELCLRFYIPHQLTIFVTLVSVPHVLPIAITAMCWLSCYIEEFMGLRVDMLDRLDSCDDEQQIENVSVQKMCSCPCVDVDCFPYNITFLSWAL